jgi:hypothetical protein
MILFIIILIITLCNGINQTPCIIDEDCDDKIWCNGIERCVESICTPSLPENVPCNNYMRIEENKDGDDDDTNIKIICSEQFHTCIEIFYCNNDDDCDDGLWCNGNESCNTETGTCYRKLPTLSPCDQSNQEICHEDTKKCINNQNSEDNLIGIPIFITVLALILLIVSIILLVRTYGKNNKKRRIKIKR